MSNRKKFIYNGILLALVGLAIKGVNLAFSAFVSREIGAEALGLYTLIGTVYSFAVTFATSGINLTVTRLVASAVGEGRDGAIGKIMRNAVLYSIVFSGVATLVLFFLAPYFGERVLMDARSVLPLRILAVSLVPISLGATLSGYFIGVKRIVKNAVVQVASQVFRIVVTVFFVLKMAPLGAEYAVSALCISTVLGELFSFAVSFFQYLFEPRGKSGGTSPFSDVSSMALPLAVSAYIRSALLTLEHVLIPNRLRYGGESEADALSSYGTLHGMALPVILYPMSPLSSFAGLLVPEFAEGLAGGERGRMSRICSEVISKTLVYATPCAVFLYLFAEELGYAIYSSSAAGAFIASLAPVVPIMYLDHVTDSVLKGIGEHVYSMWVNISDSLLSVLLIWFLIPKMGIFGYAVVIVVMEAYNFLLSILRLRSRIKFRVDLISSLVFPGAAAALAALVSKVAFGMSGKETGILWLILKAVFAVSVFLFIVFIKDLIKNIMEKKKVDKREEKCYTDN